MNNLKDIILIIALAVISVVDSWASCTTTSSNYYPYSGNSNIYCKADSRAQGNFPLCSSTPACMGGQYSVGTYHYTNCYVNYNGRNACNFIEWAKSSYYDIYCKTRCTTQDEADSIVCVNNGKIWDVDPVSGVGSCVDSISCNWTVSEIPFLRCLDVPASSEITCINGECSGLPYAMWWSEFRIDSVSTRCGRRTEQHISDTTYSFGAHCYDGETCSNEKKCVSDGGIFYLYNLCNVGTPEVNNDGITQKTVPYIVATGKGSCSEMGYRNEIYKNSGGGIGNPNAIEGNPSPISDDCLVYGIGCPEQDTTNYRDPPNQNPSKCYCEPFDGIGSMSKVTCPDGTVSIYYFSCLEWEYMFSSSSQSSSSAASPSSGGSSSTLAGGSSSDTFGQYPQYLEQDGAYKKNVQAALSGEASLLTSIKDILGTIKDYLMGTPALGDDVFSLEVPVDSSTYDTTQVNVNYIDSLLAVIDTANSPIDTSLKAQTGVCPIISANFGAVCKYIPLANVQGSNMQIDTSNIGGFNICAIIRGLIIGFASVVSFIIGARMFRQITIT